MDQLSKLFGSVFGLAAFAVAVIAGLSVGNAPSQVLFKAIVCMMICYVVGTLLGLIAERTVAEQARAYAGQRAIPEVPDVTDGAISPAGDSSVARNGERTG